MIILALLVLILICGLGAMRAPRLLNAALWLAAVSGLMAVLFYTVDAWMLAVIELSVGTGLVTVFMVFAITMIGDEHESSHIKPLPLTLIFLTLLLLIFATVPFLPDVKQRIAQTFSIILWENRGLDVLLQVALIFAGIIGILGVLRSANTSDDSAEATARQLIDSDDEPTFTTESQQQQTLEKEVI